MILDPDTLCGPQAQSRCRAGASSLHPYLAGSQRGAQQHSPHHYMCVSGNLETWAWVCSAGYQMSTLGKATCQGPTLFLRIGDQQEQVPTPEPSQLQKIHAVPHLGQWCPTVSHAGLDFESITRTLRRSPVNR